MKIAARYWPVLVGPIVTLAISLGWTSSLDSFKLLALSLVAGLALSSIILNSRHLSVNLSSQAYMIAIIFIFGLSVPMFFSNSPLAQQVYGVSGRNLGFLHYLFLIFIFLGFTALDFQKLWPRILKSLVILGSFEAGYGSLQLLGFDPAPWKNPDKWIFGTFGNPNYFSSFLALSAIATLYFAIVAKRLAYRWICSVLVLFQGGMILLSSSSQGLILLSFGVCAFITFFAFNRSKILGLISVLCAFLIGIMGVLGILQIGPFSRFLYQVSVSYRGDYWRAGIKMFQENWLSGVGLDSFGDYYRLYRDATAANRRGLDVFSNSAHNIFIDLAATGGFLLVLSYLLILVVIIFSILKTFRNATKVSFEYKVLVTLWVAFNLQTLISINVPSLAVWGWIFSGLIIAHGNVVRPPELLGRNQAKSQKMRFVLTTSACCLFCLALVAPLINREVSLANALAANNISRISAALLGFPRDADQIASVAGAYDKIGRTKESYELAKSAISENSNSVRAWKIIYLSTFSSVAEKENAQRNLQKLDPHQMSD